MPWLLKASNSRYILVDIVHTARWLYSLNVTCLVPVENIQTCCIYVLVILSELRSVNVSSLVKVPSGCFNTPGVNICALSLLVKGVPGNDHMNPIWIDTVCFGMLPILDAHAVTPQPLPATESHPPSVLTHTSHSAHLTTY